MSEATAVPKCPGCHFGCSVNAYQCGRGKEFYGLWLEGKPVPKRESPLTKREGGMNVEARAMHGLNIMANILQDRHAEPAERKALMATARQGGFFSLKLLGKRTLIEEARLEDAVESLITAGLATRDSDEVTGPVLRATPEGIAQFTRWSAERDAATAEFLAPLSEEELEQLASMLSRLIQPHMKLKHKGE